MVKFYPLVFSPYIQDKHNQTVIRRQLFRRHRSEKCLGNPAMPIVLKQWEIELLEALMPLQSPEAETIGAIMCYAKQASTP